MPVHPNRPTGADDGRAERKNTMENYSIGCWEIDRFETHLCYSGIDIGGNNFFGNEEEAVAYGKNYVKEHPGWTFEVFKLMRACFESV